MLRIGLLCLSLAAITASIANSPFCNNWCQGQQSVLIPQFCGAYCGGYSSGYSRGCGSYTSGCGGCGGCRSGYTGCTGGYATNCGGCRGGYTHGCGGCTGGYTGGYTGGCWGYNGGYHNPCCPQYPPGSGGWPVGQYPNQGPVEPVGPIGPTGPAGPNPNNPPIPFNHDPFKVAVNTDAQKHKEYICPVDPQPRNGDPEDPVECEYDENCPSDKVRQKCCYDSGLGEKVCKPAVLA